MYCKINAQLGWSVRDVNVKASTWFMTLEHVGQGQSISSASKQREPLDWFHRKWNGRNCRGQKLAVCEVECSGRGFQAWLFRRCLPTSRCNCTIISSETSMCVLGFVHFRLVAGLFFANNCWPSPFLRNDQGEPSGEYSSCILVLRQRCFWPFLHSPFALPP